MPGLVLILGLSITVKASGVGDGFRSGLREGLHSSRNVMLGSRRGLGLGRGLQVGRLSKDGADSLGAPAC